MANWLTPEIIPLIIILITLSISLVKIIEVLIKKIIPKKSPILSEDEFVILKEVQENVKDFSEDFCESYNSIKEIHLWTKSLIESHSKTDINGTPLWYVPRSFLDTQKELINILNNLTKHHEKTTFILEEILDKIRYSENKE